MGKKYHFRGFAMFWSRHFNTNTEWWNGYHSRATSKGPSSWGRSTASSWLNSWVTAQRQFYALTSRGSIHYRSTTRSGEVEERRIRTGFGNWTPEWTWSPQYQRLAKHSWAWLNSTPPKTWWSCSLTSLQASSHLVLSIGAVTISGWWIRRSGTSQLLVGNTWKRSAWMLCTRPHTHSSQHQSSCGSTITNRRSIIQSKSKWPRR